MKAKKKKRTRQSFIILVKGAVVDRALSHKVATRKANALRAIVSGHIKIKCIS